MCIVIDSCSLQRVFYEKNSDLMELRKWIFEGPGKVVYGGSKYLQELGKAPRYLSIFKELEKIRKTVKAPASAVNASESRIKREENSADFDDAHLIAIIEETGCCLICSNDKRADKFIKNRALYKKRSPPSIYRQEPTHVHLLCDKNIAACCR